MSKMNFTHSSRKSWALIRWLGAAQQSPKSTHSSVSTNAVAAHLIQVAKAPHNKKFKCQVCMQGRTLLQQMSDKSLLHPFTEEEISTALQKTKPATAPGYDNIHVEFLKNLGLLSPVQVGFRKGQSTCDQVAALTTFIENGFQQNLKTCAVFLDLTAAYDTVWHTGLLYKLSKSMPYWFTRLVLWDQRFRVHMGNDTSS